MQRLVVTRTRVSPLVISPLFFVRTSMSEHFPWQYVAALTALAALGTAAQPAAPGSPASSAVSGTSTPPHTTPYRSAFDNYRSFADEKPVPWKEANETVRAVGGWRAYAREASEAPAAPPSSPGTPATPHHGHSRP
jgi:hypothetical protein